MSFHEPETWVAVAFVLFCFVLYFVKAHEKVLAMLDERGDTIAKELAEAKRLREEAQALLDEYKRKRVEAEKNAENIVSQAKADAEAYAAEAHRKLAETVERRTRQAEQKIAQAEAAAIKDVRETAASLAIAAATRLVGETAKGTRGAKLIEASIAAVKTRLNGGPIKRR
jgi:F-type H+-transporting ATPase subunit b